MKKKIKVILSMILVIVVLVVTGNLLGYLTSQKQITNVFTLGRVKIELNEANWDASLATNLKPNDSIEKDPAIKNIGRNEAYVYLKVITPIVELMDESEKPLFNYTTNSGWTELSSIDDCNYQIKTYYYNTALNPNSSTTTLFDEVTLANFGPNVETNQDMIIYGYAIQTNYLQNGTTIPTIFTSHFSNNLSNTTVTCPGMVKDYNGEGCATITNDSTGGGGNANMSGLTLMMKNESLGTDENINFTLPAANWIDNNFSGGTIINGPANTTTYYYTYADNYTFNYKTGRFSLINPSIDKYDDIGTNLTGKYIVGQIGSTSSNLAQSSDLDTIYKVTEAHAGYENNSFIEESYKTAEISTSAQSKYFTYADNYTFDNTTGKFTLTNPSVGIWSNIYTTLKDKYIVALFGSTSSTIANSSNLSTIYKVIDTPTLTSHHYQISSVEKPLKFVTSKTTQIEGDNGQGIYTRNGTENDKYPIYYYRGTKTLSNNIVFGGFCWKIIRTTATGGIRMIYNGEKNSDNSCGTDNGNNIERSSSQTEIKLIQGTRDGDNYTYSIGNGTVVIPFNLGYYGNKYVGYMYKTNEENDTESNLKRALDAWYNGYLMQYDKKIEDSIYCNDRTYLINETRYNYCPQIRTKNGTPTTLCTRTMDAFGVKNGNKKSTYKVGFLTSDEDNLAGASWKYIMKDYLYNGSYYWTGSPYHSGTNYAYVSEVNWGNSISGYLEKTNDVYASAVRPVITLKANTPYVGTGTLTDPFIVN